MEVREIRRIISSYLFFYAAILCLPFLLAAYYQFRIGATNHPQPHTTVAFFYTILLCLGSAWLLARGTSASSNFFYRQKEALISVVLIWLITPAIGALPFIFSGTLEQFNQAYFEAASGFTTTGATILEAKHYDPQTGIEIPIHNPSNVIYTYYGTVSPVIDPFTGKTLQGIEAVSHALLFWRSLMQWIGGMGIIVLFVAFLPQLGLQGKFLFQTEAPSSLKEGCKPRIKEAALQLWGIYFSLTLLQIILLMGFNSKMQLFDAITLALSTVSTGGFSIHNENVAFYRHPTTEWIIFIFMILGSLNFSFYYQFLKSKFYRLFDAELITFLLTLVCLGGFIYIQIVQIPQIALDGKNMGLYTHAEALRIGLFQLVSAQTSTGFFLDSYDHWPSASKVILLLSMYLGGMSGSAAGGFKIIRIQILLKTAKSKIESLFQPKTIKTLQIGNRKIDDSAAMSVLCFFFIAIALSFMGTFAYICDQIDPETAFGLTASMVNNTGMAFKAAGPSHTMAFLSPLSTYISSFLMILGRLEYFVVLTLFFPAFWRRT